MAINPNMAPRVRPLISCWIKYSIPRELPLPSISPFEPGRRPTVVGDNLTHAIDKPQQLRHQAVTVDRSPRTAPHSDAARELSKFCARTYRLPVHRGTAWYHAVRAAAVAQISPSPASIAG